MELEIPTKFENMCRTCMSMCNQENLIFQSVYDCINDYQNQNTFIFELLHSTIQQLPRIERTDELPKTICENCLSKLSACYEFQQCCLNSDVHLRKLIATDGINIYTTSDSAILDPLQDDSNQSFSFPDVEDFIKQEELESNSQVIDDTIKGEESDLDTNSILLSPVSAQSNTIASEDVVTEKYESSAKIEKAKSAETCKFCEKLYSSTKYLKRHIKRMHYNELPQINKDEQNEAKKDKPFKCNECDSAFEKRSYLRKHKYRHKQPGGLKTMKKCHICGMAFQTVEALKRHCSILHQELSGNNILDITKPYICEYCNKGFQQSCTLKDHKRIHTKETPFLCSHCGKAFNSNSNLQQHLLRHTGEKRYECPDCPKKFPCLSDLFSHKQVHKKMKPHVCDICSAAFGKPSQLKKHKMYHSGEKPYQCEYCEMRFVCADHMRRHMRTHTGEKPYKCKYCPRTFTQSNDMIKHLRLHLGVNVYQCELCPAAFRLATELREHFALHKNDNDETREQNKRALLEAQEKLRHKLELDKAISVSENV